MTSNLYDPRATRAVDQACAASVDDVAARIAAFEQTLDAQDGALGEAFDQLRAFGDCTFGLPNSDMDEIEQVCVPRVSNSASAPLGQKC